MVECGKRCVWTVEASVLAIVISSSWVRLRKSQRVSMESKKSDMSRLRNILVGSGALLAVDRGEACDDDIDADGGTVTVATAVRLLPTALLLIGLGGTGHDTHDLGVTHLKI